MFNRKKYQTLVEYCLIAGLVVLVLAGACEKLLDGTKTNFYYGLLPTNQQLVDLPPPPEGNNTPTTNMKPHAVIQGPTEVHIGDMVTYTDASYDTDGNITQTSWGDRVLVTQFNTEGVHTITLTVWDDKGASDTVSLKVTVTNPKPVAVISLTPQDTTLWKNGFTVSAKYSYDPDGDAIYQFEWMVNNQPRPLEYDENHLKYAAGVYVIKLRVQDEWGKWSDWAEKRIEVVANRKPTTQIKMNYSSSEGLTEKTAVSFYLVSSDPDGDRIVNYEWSNKQTYYPVGTHTVKARVQDEWGLWSDWYSLTFVVNQSNRAPIPTIIMNPSKNVTTLDTITWSYSYTDPDGDIISAVQWSNKKSSYPVGTHTVQLRVQDSRGLWSNWVSKTFTVVSGNTPPVAVLNIDPTTNVSPNTLVQITSTGSYDNDAGDRVDGFELYTDGLIYSSTTGSLFKYDKFTTGTHNFQLRVKDSHGAWSSWVYKTLTVVQPTTYNPPTSSSNNSYYEAGTSTAIGHLDDSSTAQDLPFTFRFYDKDFNRIYINNNGSVHFMNQTSAYRNYPLSDSSAPNYSIFAFWDDLDYRSVGTVRYGEYGVAPNRYVVIRYAGPNHYSDTGNGVDFAIVLHESGKIELKYSDVLFDYSSYDCGASATVGIKKDNSTYNQYSYDSSKLFNGLSITYMPQ